MNIHSASPHNCAWHLTFSKSMRLHLSWKKYDWQVSVNDLNITDCTSIWSTFLFWLTLSWDWLFFLFWLSLASVITWSQNLYQPLIVSFHLFMYIYKAIQVPSHSHMFVWNKKLVMNCSASTFNWSKNFHLKVSNINDPESDKNWCASKFKWFKHII